MIKDCSTCAFSGTDYCHTCVVQYAAGVPFYSNYEPAEELGHPCEEQDIIANPEHYVSAGGLQPIELIMSADHSGKFCKGNIIKYGFRAGSKIYDGLTAGESEIKDLEKVIQYAEFRIRQLKGLPVIERS